MKVEGFVDRSYVPIRAHYFRNAKRMYDLLPGGLPQQ